MKNDTSHVSMISKEGGSMTREDSIELADRLENDYSKLEKLQKESYQNTKEIDRPYTPRRKMGKEERLGFNWYPVIGFLVCIPLLILALLFYVFAFAMRWDHKPGADLYQVLSMVMVVLSVIVFLGLQVIGSKRNRAEVTRFNEGVEREVKTREEKMSSLKKRNIEIDLEIADLQKELSEYNETVPQHFRTGSYMFQVKKLLQTEKAEDFDEAITLLQKKYQ